MIGFIGPLLYSFVLGMAWSVCFNKKFINSLAPAYMLHIIFVLISGLLFNTLSIGIWGGFLIVCVSLFAFQCFFLLRKIPTDRDRRQVKGADTLFLRRYDPYQVHG